MLKHFIKISGFIVFILIINSCAVSKEARSMKSQVNGNWQLQTIISEGITGKIKTQLFNEEDFNCFVGSLWNFNMNNSLGNYKISKNAKECAAIRRNIRWSIYEPKDEPKQLQFKRLDDKLNEIDENSGGFRFTILNMTNTSMQLKSNIEFEGKPASFIYKFVKN